MKYTRVYEKTTIAEVTYRRLPLGRPRAIYNTVRTILFAYELGKATKSYRRKIMLRCTPLS